MSLHIDSIIYFRGQCDFTLASKFISGDNVTSHLKGKLIFSHTLARVQSTLAHTGKRTASGDKMGFFA